MTIERTAKVHSYDEGPAVVHSTLSTGEDIQSMANGATVELIDDTGSSHSHRFLDVAAAREVFGVVGTTVKVTYQATDIPVVEAKPEPEPVAEPAAEA